MNPTSDIHEWVAQYNWDDGLAPIWRIASSDQTEFATALMIYWRLGGPWLEDSSGSAAAEAIRLQSLVRERLLTGKYERSDRRYDPISDNQLSKTQVHKLRKSGLPSELIEPTCPPRERD